MEDYAARIELAPEPQSAARARRWMRQVLDDIERPELTESAATGVSELVTNGILHANTSISLLLQTFGERVIITVTDRSAVPTTRVGAEATHDEESTVGRGLQIVRAYATDWGVTSSQHGKAIWFAPAETARAISLHSLPAFDLLGHEEASEPSVEGPYRRVVLRDTPIAVLRGYLERWSELLRELHLIALGEPSPLQTLAQGITDLVPMTRGTRWMTAESAADLAESAVTGSDRLDLEFDVPVQAAAAFSRLLELLQRLDTDEHQDQLLLFAGGDRAAALRDWWFGQFAAQLEGAAPRPWTGAFDPAEIWQSF